MWMAAICASSAAAGQRQSERSPVISWVGLLCAGAGSTAARPERGAARPSCPKGGYLTTLTRRPFRAGCVRAVLGAHEARLNVVAGLGVQHVPLDRAVRRRAEDSKTSWSGTACLPLLAGPQKRDHLPAGLRALDPKEVVHMHKPAAVDSAHELVVLSVLEPRKPNSIDFVVAAAAGSFAGEDDFETVNIATRGWLLPATSIAT